MVQPKKNTPLLSLILPVYNGSKFLKKSIDSLLNQTFKDFELIIIDDFSSDDSLKIIGGYSDKRIKLFKNKKNKGSVESYNLGLENAKGKYVAIATQDDIFHPRRLEIELNYLESHPRIFLVGASAIYIDEEEKEIKRFRKYDDSNLLKWRLKKSNSIIFPSIMFRKTKLRFDNYHEYHFYYKLIRQGKKLTNLPNFLVKYRVHNNAESVFDKENQEKKKTFISNKFKNLNYGFSLFEKVIFSLKLYFHYLKTFREKKILLKN